MLPCRNWGGEGSNNLNVPVDIHDQVAVKVLASCKILCVSFAVCIQAAVKVLALTPDASSTHPLVISMQEKLLVLLHSTTSCAHVCHHFGATIKGTDLLIVMQLYKESLADLVLKQQGVLSLHNWDAHECLKLCKEFPNFSCVDHLPSQHFYLATCCVHW